MVKSQDRDLPMWTPFMYWRSGRWRPAGVWARTFGRYSNQQWDQCSYKKTYGRSSFLLWGPQGERSHLQTRKKTCTSTRIGQWSGISYASSKTMRTRGCWLKCPLHGICTISPSRSSLFPSQRPLWLSLMAPLWLLTWCLCVSHFPQWRPWVLGFADWAR